MQEELWRENIFTCITRVAQIQRQPLDLSMLKAVVFDQKDGSAFECLKGIAKAMNLSAPTRLEAVDPAYCPIITENEGVWGIVLAPNPSGGWLTLVYDSVSKTLEEEIVSTFPKTSRFFRLNAAKRFSFTQSPSLKLILKEILSERRGLIEIVSGSLFIGTVALVTSLYAMQVYDRVIPTSASATLLVLTLGVMLAITLDALAKWLRMRVIASMSDRIDQRLARSVYARFLGVRLDVMPSSVGMMAQRIRSYETVRQLLLGSVSGFIVDVPLAIILLLVLSAIGGLLAVIPASFLLAGIIGGIIAARQTTGLAAMAIPAHNQKTGHLVESIEALELIKSGNGSWRNLAKWLELTDRARSHDYEIKKVNDRFQVAIGYLQQIGYVTLIAFGATYVSQGEITLGALIACSILSSRIVAPLFALTQIIVQWATAKASLQDLDQFWVLEQDISSAVNPLWINEVHGEFLIEDAHVSHSEVPALHVPKLLIRPGESIAVLGPIGSGKTTLLRLLTGLYKPEKGQVRLDGLNLSDIDKAVLSSQIAYVPQDGRLFEGTLRENLLIGLTDPGDEHLTEAARKTGLFDTVIAPHPKGLNRTISEGGTGLSGGQRQLVHITRALLRHPKVWLLDEPTAAMDRATEEHVINALQNIRDADPSCVFVFVTHKSRIAGLSERIIVLNAGKIVMDGPKNEVLERLSGKAVNQSHQSKQS